MPKRELKPLKYKPDSLKGISQKTVEIHHGKLYAGYVSKSNEISEKLGELRRSGKAEGNQTYSELRGLKLGETFAINGVYLHENYFGILGGDGVPRGEIKKAIEKKWGSMEEFQSYFSACGMAARGAIPIIAMDVYEHSYFIDTGSDRAAYIKAFFENLNWDKIEELYQKAKNYEL